MGREIKLTEDIMIVSETDDKGRILYANSDFCKVAEYEKDELIGQHHNIVRHPDMPKAGFKDLWQTVKSGKNWSGIVINSTKNGNYYWVYATVTPSRDVNGNVRYISVRVKPTDEEVDRAKALYKTLT